MSRWTLKIPRVCMNGKTGKEEWKKCAIETIQPLEETVFKIFYRISSSLSQTVHLLGFGEPRGVCTSTALTWQLYRG